MMLLHASLSLPSFLAGEKILQANDPQTWIITGPRGAGKTDLCEQIVDHCRKNDLQVGGVLSRAQIKAGQKTGMILEDLQSGQRKLLGSLHPRPLHTLEVGRWYFDPTVLAWGNECLRAAAHRDVVIFDECGFLELDHGQGFAAGLHLFDKSSFRMGVVVVRPELLSVALERWPLAQVVEAAPHIDQGSKT